MSTRGRRFVVWGLSLALVVVGVGIMLAFSAGRAMGAAGATWHRGVPGQSETEERTFTVMGAPTFALAGDNGAVTITRGDSDTQVIVQATKWGASVEELHRVRVEMTQNGDTITVREERSRKPFSFGPEGVVKYTVQLPRRANIAPLRTGIGTVSVSGIAGNLDLATDNGSVTVRDFDGPLAVRTDNGRVMLANGTGAVRVTTDNGAVDMQNVRAMGLSVRTANGRVGYAGSLAPGSDTRIETSNGAVTVATASGQRFHPRHPNAARARTSRLSDNACGVGSRGARRCGPRRGARGGRSPGRDAHGAHRKRQHHRGKGGVTRMTALFNAMVPVSIFAIIFGSITAHRYMRHRETIKLIEHGYPPDALRGNRYYPPVSPPVTWVPPAAPPPMQPAAPPFAAPEPPSFADAFPPPMEQLVAPPYPMPAPLPLPHRGNRTQLLWGCILVGVGFALSLALWPIGFAVNAGGTVVFPLGIGPWMVAGFIPLFVGLALLLTYTITGGQPHSPASSRYRHPDRRER